MPKWKDEGWFSGDSSVEYAYSHRLMDSSGVMYVVYLKKMRKGGWGVDGIIIHVGGGYDTIFTSTALTKKQADKLVTIAKRKLIEATGGFR